MNHSKAYSSEDNTNTNLGESLFSRIQRAYVGVYHHFWTWYLDWYVADLAWDEDTRRTSNRWLTRTLLSQALQRPTSRYLCGYWQGNKPPNLIWDGDSATPR